MANINTELNVIANSVYGSEMRSAIHDAINKVNTDLDKTVVTLTFNEYDNLSSDEKLNGSLYFTYDTKQIFMNGVEYTQDNNVTGMKQGNCLYFNAASAPLDNLDIDLKPVQSMRGYGEAWAGGRGKNKLQLSISGTDTVDGVTFKVTEDFRIRLNGDATDDIEYVIGTFSFSGSSDKTYTLNGCPSGGSSSSYRMCINGVYDYGADSDGVTVTLSPGVSYPVKICINNGTSLTRAVFKPMLRENGNSNFRPYSNVCPIYKNSTMKYYSLGKNLFSSLDAVNVNDYILNARGEFTSKPGEGYFYGTPIAPNTTYTLSGIFIPDDKVMYVYTFDEFENVRRVYGPISYNELPYTFQAGPLAKSFGFSYDQGEFVPGSVQLEVGTLATAKDNFDDHTYDLTIGINTWGGKWHVEDGFLDEEWAEIASYAGEPLPYEWYSSENTYGVQESPNIGAQVVYKTGNIVRKTANYIEVGTVKGVNTIWGGNVEWISLTYTNSAWQDIIHYKELYQSEYDNLSESDKKNGTIYFIIDCEKIYLNDIAYCGGGGDASKTELKQAEYDALVEAGEVDPNMMYFVTDGEGGGGGSSSQHTYSTEEQVVGTWIDGKPIYEKTFVLPNEITLTTDTWASLGISLSGVETPISSEARNSRQAVECTVDFLDDPITAMSTMRNSSGKITSVTLRYTKTTT